MSTASAPSLPQDVADLIAQFDEADRRASQMVESLTDAQVNWQPRQGAAWSVAQCLDHMATTTRIYISALRAAAPQARTGHHPLQPAGWFSRYFLKKTEPPVSIKIKGPKKIQPASDITKDEAVSHFLESNYDARRFASETSGLDLCGTRFKNPFVPGLNFTIATGVLVIAAHTRRHLWQLEQVLKDPAFPR
jgi:hypothetical protein